MKSYYSWLICFLFATVTVFAQPESALTIYKDLKLFKSPLALALKNNVKKSDIGTIQNPQLRELANLLLNKQYNPAYRVAKYKAFLDPVTLGKELMIGDGYSKYENLTGIFYPLGSILF